MPSYDEHDPQEFDHDRLRRVLGLQIASRTEWDQPPRLYAISRDTDGVFRLEADQVVYGVFASVQRAEQSRGEQLEAAADALYRMVRQYPGLILAAPGFCGLAFECEAWGMGPVMEDPPGPHDDAALQTASRKLQTELDVYGNRVSYHPDRIETIQVTAATTDRFLHWGQWNRGAAAPKLEYHPVQSGAIGGAIPEQLRRIVRILNRHTGQ